MFCVPLPYMCIKLDADCLAVCSKGPHKVMKQGSEDEYAAVYIPTVRSKSSFKSSQV